MSTSFTGSSLQTGTSPVRAVAYSAGRSTCATTSMGRASTWPPKRRNSSTSSAVVKNEWTGTLPERAWARRRRQDVIDVAGRLVGRVHQRDLAPHHAPDERLQKRIVGAAQNERVDVAAAQRLQVLPGDVLELRADVDLGGVGHVVLDGPVGELQPHLGDLHEPRRRRGEHGDAGVDVAYGVAVGVGIHGALGGDDPHAPVERRMGRRPGAGSTTPTTGTEKFSWAWARPAGRGPCCRR